MDLRALLEKQKELDNMILEKAGIKEYPWLNMKLALLVELGELANEVQSFKHWKHNKNVNRERVLEEFADCFHFALSLENEFNQMLDELIDNPNNFNISYDAVFPESYEGNEDFETSAILGAYEYVVSDKDYLMAIISMGMCLEIDLEEMEQAYLKKHQENIRRQQEGY